MKRSVTIPNLLDEQIAKLAKLEEKSYSNKLSELARKGIATEVTKP